MGKVQAYRNSLSRFISSDSGQRFFNIAYSVGAAIVIWGALFKILHLPGGNMLLSIGMGTEVLMFMLTAFDRPPREYKWEDVFPQLQGNGDEDGEAVQVTAGYGATVTGAVHPGTVQPFAPSGNPVEDVTEASRFYIEQVTAAANEMQQLRQTTASLNAVSSTLLESYQAITENSDEITRTSKGYVEQIKDLNRNISGLNTIYEIQLRGVSSQLDSIDRVNRGIKDIRDMYEKSAGQSARYVDETEKMARYMQQLNSIYEKMITAMTVNMYRPMAGVADNAGPEQ